MTDQQRLDSMRRSLQQIERMMTFAFSPARRDQLNWHAESLRKAIKRLEQNA